MAHWKYINNKATTIECKGNRDYPSYYGVCSECPFINGEYGDGPSSDKVWCSSPVPLNKGDKIRLIEIKKYRYLNK